MVHDLILASIFISMVLAPALLTMRPARKESD
jgi:hypothetical protein